MMKKCNYTSHVEFLLLFMGPGGGQPVLFPKKATAERACKLQEEVVAVSFVAERYATQQPSQLIA